MRYRAKQPHKFWHATGGKVAGIQTVETTIVVLVSPTCRIPFLGERLKRHGTGANLARNRSGWSGFGAATDVLATLLERVQAIERSSLSERGVRTRRAASAPRRPHVLRAGGSGVPL